MSRYSFILILNYIIFFSGQLYAQEPILLEREDLKSAPALVYVPYAKGCQGIAIVSHGAGGSEEGYAYLGRAMSDNGYLTVVVGHLESGREALKQYIKYYGLKDGLSALVTNPDTYRARLMDISAAKNWAQSVCSGKRVILIGHSMGAATAMIEAGAKNKLGLRGSDSFDAYIALSPQGIGPIFPPNAWRKIRKPVLSMTGTLDDDLQGDSWKARIIPFLNMRPGCKWVGIIKGATHLNFAGIGSSLNVERLTEQTIKAFLRGIEQGRCQITPRYNNMIIRSK